MAIQPMALQVQNVQGNALGAFAQGQNQAQDMRERNLQMARATLENVGSLAFGVMGGKLDGAPDPARWEEALDMIGQQGVDVSMFRNRPDLAPVIARASVDVLGQMNNNLNERQLEQRMKEFDFQVSEALKGPAPVNPSYSQTPVFLTDPEGNQHVAQMSSTGGVLINGQQLPGVPQGWSVVNRPQALTTINDGSQIQAFNPNLGAGTATPLATIQGDPSANMNVTVDPTTGERSMAPAAGSEQAREVNAGKVAAQNAITTFERKSGLMSDTLDTAIAQIEANPALVTGLGGDLTKVVPGTPAYDLAQTLLTIQANIGFDALQQMREASPTGGALGAISDTENRLLQAVQGATAQGQSAGQLLTNLRNIQTLSKEVAAERRRAFAATFPDNAPAADAVTPTTAPSGSIDDLLEKYQ